MNEYHAQTSQAVFDVEQIRKDFPILKESINGHSLIYLDNAATTHKPQVVIDTITEFYQSQNANIHRGVHTLSQRGTDAYEGARVKVKNFINANSASEIIFTRGTTDSINLAANSLARYLLSKGDEILISESEHHSNIVPWQLCCEQSGATLKIIPLKNR